MCRICNRDYDENTTEIDCLECPDVTEIPNVLINLISLDISSCNITTIPLLPELQTLECEGCKNLIFIAVLPKLQFLNCSKCPKLREIPDIIGLQELYCFETDLAIPDSLINLEILDCSDTLITRLPHTFVKLDALYCMKCPNLIEIPNFSRLAFLNCAYCPSLTAVPEIESLQNLICFNCDNLKLIPSSLSNLRWLSCSSCPKLTEISCEIITLDHITCVNCRLLTRAPKTQDNFYCDCHWLNPDLEQIEDLERCQKAVKKYLRKRRKTIQSQPHLNLDLWKLILDY